MLSLKKKSAVLFVSAGLAFSLAACGSDDTANTSTGAETTTETASAEPVAEIDSLSGKQTA